MVSDQLPSKSIMGMRQPVFLLSVFVVFVSLCSLWIISERRAADRERAAFENLIAMGASGNDWISLRELITGRPPVVTMDIPAAIPVQTAFEALPHLKNLEFLTLAYPTLTADQISVIERLKLVSLRFKGTFPTDHNIDQLSALRGVKFLQVPSRNLSANAQEKLQSLLPTSEITYR